MRPSSQALCSGRSLGAPVCMASEAMTVLAMDRRGAWPGPSPKLSASIVLEGLSDLLAGVHHEGSMLYDRFTDGPSL